MGGVKDFCSIRALYKAWIGRAHAEPGDILGLLELSTNTLIMETTVTSCVPPPSKPLQQPNQTPDGNANVKKKRDGGLCRDKCQFARIVRTSSEDSLN